MTLKILENVNRVHRPSITLQPSSGRLLFNKLAWLELVERNGTESSYVQIMIDEETKQSFWLKLCDSTALGSRKLDVPSPNTRTCNIGNLLEALALKIDCKTKLNLIYDAVAGAYRVDVDPVYKKEPQNVD